MLHLTGPNTKRQGPKSPMCRRMTVSTNASGSGQREALLGPNNVHDSLSLVLHAEVLEAEVVHVGSHLQHLGSASSLLDKALYVE